MSYAPYKLKLSRDHSYEDYQKVKAIKLVRSLTGMCLKGSKGLVENADLAGGAHLETSAAPTESSSNAILLFKGYGIDAELADTSAAEVAAKVKVLMNEAINLGEWGMAQSLFDAIRYDSEAS